MNTAAASAGASSTLPAAPGTAAGSVDADQPLYSYWVRKRLAEQQAATDPVTDPVPIAS